jgi:hypothetical protein
MFYDSWGNEYKTKKDAIKGIYKICETQDEHDYWEMISEYMLIPSEIMDWIVGNHLHSFREQFADEILKAENNWCESYIEELEEDYF